MRTAFILSLLLHLFLAALVFFFIKEKADIKRDVFYADLIRPAEGDREKKTEILPIPKGGYSSSAKTGSKIKGPSKNLQKRQRDNQSDNRTSALASKPQDSGYGARDKKESQRQIQREVDQSAQPPSLAPQALEGASKQGMPERKTFRERIFDKDVIKEIARADKPTTEKEGTITFDTKEFKYHGYLKRLRERIEGVWRYPHEAAERGIYGDLYLKFTIKKNGQLGSVELVRTSGHKVLDDAAMRALREADPFWPLPDELGKDAFTITGHFVYSIYGTYIR